MSNDALLHYAGRATRFVVIGIDRLGRHAAEAMATSRELRDRDIALRSLRDGIDTSNAAGRMVAVDAPDALAVVRKAGLA